MTAFPMRMAADQDESVAEPIDVTPLAKMWWVYLGQAQGLRQC